eukprot:gene31464-11280_t
MRVLDATAIDALYAKVQAAPLAFAVGARVLARGLVSAAALNGCAGTVRAVRVGEGDAGDRVAVDFGPPHGQKVVRPENLRLAVVAEIAPPPAAAAG